jgi:hypothetical protein
MSKSMMTIHKEIEKKEYAKSPLGLLEKKISAFYDKMVMAQKKLPENLAKEVYDIRDKQEKKYMEYLELRMVEDKKHIDSLLEEAFIKELAILEKYDG